MSDTPILQQQIAYYRARASEYDEWFYRLNRYDKGEAVNQQWFEDVALLLRTVSGLGHVGTALELACGTGIWTRELVKLVDQVTALDASPEMIDLNRSKLNAPNVTYRQVDLFAWEPDKQYDLVFFAFWLSHVPPERLADFLAKVSRAVRPGGRVFMINSRENDTSPAKDNPLRADEHIERTRKLNDGREFKIIKVFYQPTDLRSALSQAGFSASVQTTPHHFIYASGVKEQAS